MEKKRCRVNEVVESLCNLSRSSDDWQYMGIDGLLLLLNDQVTRYQAMEIGTPYLTDLVELGILKGREGPWVSMGFLLLVGVCLQQPEEIYVEKGTILLMVLKEISSCGGPDDIDFQHVLYAQLQSWLKSTA
ncbi:hypothetical protein NE237_012911 [Protea cynaroides]|uniref:Uncharacterized protein n=1 Tax=Protea cynaroides TaxID=273540 RepID=A0A9Q0GYC2_9MAGN|nr:hypothetical protein NE237_012911 [Protea cynaroides]